MARITEGTKRVVERIPHKDVAYAYLEIEAGSWNEFESLRAEVTSKHPAYSWAADAPAEPKKKVSAKSVSAPEPEARVAEVEAGDDAAVSGESDVAPVVEEKGRGVADLPPTIPPASTTVANEDADSKGLSPREKARLRLKGA
jgi:hypothetical protein